MKCQSKSWCYWIYQVAMYVVVPLVLLTLCYSHLFHGFPRSWPDKIIIIVVDLGLSALLGCCAFRIRWPIPERFIAVFMVPLLFLVLVVSFADLYKGGKRVGRGADSKDSRVEYLCHPWDAVYFSLVTITTVGYGDYAPQDQAARTIVMGEILSGALLLLFTFPVLASRLAMFDDLTTAKTVMTIEREDGKWTITEEGGEPKKFESDQPQLTVVIRGAIEAVDGKGSK